MSIVIFALILLLAFAPAALGWFYINRRGVKLRVYFALVFLGGGVLSLAFAAFAQAFLPEIYLETGIESIFFEFLRTAFLEEVSRFIVLSICFTLVRRVFRVTLNNALASSGGLLAGLSFAALETAAHAATETGALLTRALSAAPLHGACGLRCAQSANCVKGSPVKALGRFASAAALHGFYNLMIPRGGLSSALAIILAISSLISGLRPINNAANE
ncbi:MAG: hypothetical protein LBG79_06910 [Spirochaetaceae bacterium]|jgi:RsiW-degrading membrane proteinase PrsW (M82 family)|nr:hypothetical protein [Spirochaetaceae bacterium]GMO20766.1 MAG: hypothetical protein Pg6A_07650 [Termitinemataceae bacterium]